MKTLKLYSIFAVLILSVTFIMWIMGFLPTEEAIGTITTTASVLGVLFLTTLILQGIVKPVSKSKDPKPKP